MHETSVGATVYAAWRNFFFGSLFRDYTDDDELRLKMAGNYPFNDFIQRMILTLGKDPENQRFNRICAHGYIDYKGGKSCLYNFARALSDSFVFLSQSVSPEAKDWEWKNVHVNEYANMPWSLSPFKFLFHKEVPIGGNGNTVKVSKYSDSKVQQLKAFKATHTPNYKQVVSVSDDSRDSVMLYSHDGG